MFPADIHSETTAREERLLQVLRSTQPLAEQRASYHCSAVTVIKAAAPHNPQGKQGTLFVYAPDPQGS